MIEKMDASTFLQTSNQKRRAAALRGVYNAKLKSLGVRLDPISSPFEWEMEILKERFRSTRDATSDKLILGMMICAIHARKKLTVGMMKRELSKRHLPIPYGATSDKFFHSVNRILGETRFRLRTLGPREYNDASEVLLHSTPQKTWSRGR